MHRFRKKSDAKRSQVPENLIASHSSSQLPNQLDTPADSLPALPPASDFRTSLILPSLSRRFTLLRESNGITLGDVRSKIAQQRARGEENHILEEEEDIIVDALAAIQANDLKLDQLGSLAPTPYNTAAAFTSTPDSVFAMQQDVPAHVSENKSTDYSTSIRSGTAPSIASTPSSVYPSSTPSTASASRTSTSFRYSNKRNSNNLFGSNRFHDTSYIQSVGKGSVSSSRSTTSIIGTDSHGGSIRSIHSVKEAENNAGLVTSPDPEPNIDTSATHLPDKAKGKLIAPVSAVPTQLSQEFTPQQVGRTNLALESLIRRMEEEEETIMVPRTSALRVGALNSRTQSPKPSEAPATSTSTPIPWMTDEARVDDREDHEKDPSAVANVTIASPSTGDPIPSSPPSSLPGPHPRPGTTSPTPRLPGYIPGMPRPLTPHDIESDRDDGLTGYSTTPRARSPAYPTYGNHSTPLSFSSSCHHNHSSSVSSTEGQNQSILPPSILRSNRATIEMPPLRTKSPALGSRSRSDNSNNVQVPSPLPSPFPEERLPSELFTRRPLSPLASTIAAAGYGISRPSTPAGSLLRSNSPLSQVHPAPIPSRDTSSSRPEVGRHSRNGSLASADSHADSPPRSPGIFSNFSWMHAANRDGPNESYTLSQDVSIANMDLGSPLTSSRSASIAARAPTPVSVRTRSPNNDSPLLNGQDPILLNRVLSRRTPKRMQSPTSLPQQIIAPVALHTPPSSNSSSNLHLSVFSSASPMFSPLMNNSATSLLSVGSSYHSGPDDRKKNGWDELVEYDTQRSAWEILNSQDNHGSETDDASDAEAVENPEEVLRRTIGLSKSDIVAVQTRLVEDGKAKQASETPRSPTRRRRMSNSRASFSVAQGRESGANSPAPPPRQPTPITNVSMPPETESTARANALLNSVLLSIEAQAQTNPSGTISATSSDFPSVEPQSTTDDDSSRVPSTDSSGRQSHEDDSSSSSRMKALVEAIAGHETPLREEPSHSPDLSPVSPIEPVHSDSGEATEVPPARLWRGPSVTVPEPPSIPRQLEDVVSRKAAEATAALKNHSQATNSDPDVTIRRKPTKRIDLQHISNPLFVSSSTSVNAIPIVHSPKISQTSSRPGASLDRSTSKLSERFKKLRGSLRSKPASRDGTEVLPFGTPSVPQSSPATPHRNAQSPTFPGQFLTYTQQHHTVPASAAEQARFKVNIPPPPASASPSLLNFMSIFRKSKKNTGKESSVSDDHSGQRTPDTVSVPSGDSSQRGYVMSPPGTTRHQSSHNHTPNSIRSPTPVRPSEDYRSFDDHRAMSPTHDPAAVDQLLHIASQLGIPQSDLKELLARSGSTVSRSTTWTQASLPGVFTSVSNGDAPPMPTRPDSGLDRSRTPDQIRIANLDRSKTPDPIYNRPKTPDPVHNRSKTPDPTYNRSRTPDLTRRPLARTAVGAGRYPEGEVVRRTLIFASDDPLTPDLNGFHRKESLSSRQSHPTSAASVPSMGSTSRPPIHRPSHSHASKPSESSSFYDMYNPDQSGSITAQNGSPEDGSSAPTGAASDSQAPGRGPAIEVVQLSNGDVIWSVLDSLRQEEDDSQSLFRRSMSPRDQEGNDEIEIRVKSHGRYDSKGSNVSQVSHTVRRRLPGSNASRPETKVVKTNSSAIGHLIDNLSKSMDSGSFTFQRPAAVATQSNPTSFHSDVSGPSRDVEHELDALLNAINNPRQGS